MNSKLFFFIFIFGGATLTVQAQTPTLEAVTTQGNTTTNSISIRNLEGLSIVPDRLNSSLRTHLIKGSIADPGVVRFESASMATEAGWEFYNSNGQKSQLYIKLNTGYVGIGIPNPKTTLAVNGEVLAKKVRITPRDWPDYVFEPSYNLRSLQQLEKFITKHKHLPDIPSAKDVAKNDLDLGGNQANLLKKIEEITLYLIAQENELTEREQQIKERQQLLQDRDKRLSELEAKLETINK